MIPGPFSYHRPKSISEATGLLADLGEQSRVLAGGQSLIPMMKLRLAAPEHLIDIGAIAELKGVQRKGSTLVIGATTTQHELQQSKVATDAAPILLEASLLIADPQVRYVGTLGGNVANGDPGNDMPAVMMCLDATYRLTGSGGSRSVKARDFYQGTYVTALKPGEIVTAIEMPVPPAGHGWAYEKLKRKIGDYATAAAGAVLTVSRGKVATCTIALSNLSDTAVLATDAAKAVIGTALEKPAVEAAMKAARAVMSPASDTRGTSDYRIHVGGIMVERALKKAFSRAKG
ncbi:MAG: xanthine dehydrogenase family protein subunit M [Hyphomonadaceae bacterium]|nr:xanthine dehydrogenase family protein subunit M [Hyphomonadaceae bacterium]